MIIWLNGPFGVGKSSVASELAHQLPASKIIDPERIGYVMRRTLWRGQDYQDVELWRTMTRRWAERAGRRGTAIVPMTIVRRDVFDELTEGYRVFLLTASSSTLKARIEGSGEAQEWRSRNVERCLEAYQAGGFGEPISTDGRTPSEAAQAIAARL